MRKVQTLIGPGHSPSWLRLLQNIQQQILLYSKYTAYFAVQNFVQRPVRPHQHVTYWKHMFTLVNI